MDKLDCLKNYLKELGEATVAFSGGVDSTFLAKVAFDELGDQVKAVTLKTEFNSREDHQKAIQHARHIGIRHEIIEHSILHEKDVISNSPLRCYYCKKKVFSLIQAKNILDGTNADDDLERPGLKALKEKGVKSPLKECGIIKKEVREFSRQLGLPDYDTPSNSCLATRIPFETNITHDMLAKIEAIEDMVHNKGIDEVRARHLGSTIRLEIPERHIAVFKENSETIINTIMNLGFEKVEIGER